MDSKIHLILTAIILRAAVGLGSHLGYHTPPMFGDFEAQRHWMELTINLPISQWYFSIYNIGVRLSGINCLSFIYMWEIGQFY